MGVYPPYNRDLECDNCGHTWFCKSTRERTKCSKCDSMVYLGLRVTKKHVEQLKEQREDFNVDHWIRHNSEFTPEEYHREISKSQEELLAEHEERKEKERQEIAQLFDSE